MQVQWKHSFVSNENLEQRLQLCDWIVHNQFNFKINGFKVVNVHHVRQKKRTLRQELRYIFIAFNPKIFAVIHPAILKQSEKTYINKLFLA